MTVTLFGTLIFLLNSGYQKDDNCQQSLDLVWSNNNETDKALLYLSELFNHSSPAITKRYLGIRQEELDDIYMSL